MKKLLSMAIAALIVAGTATPAFAHSRHHAGTSAVCTVRSCTQTNVHTHNGKTYTAHHDRDGHSYYSCT